MGTIILLIIKSLDEIQGNLWVGRMESKQISQSWAVQRNQFRRFRPFVIEISSPNHLTSSFTICKCQGLFIWDFLYETELISSFMSMRSGTFILYLKDSIEPRWSFPIELGKPFFRRDCPIKYRRPFIDLQIDYGKGILDVKLNTWGQRLQS